MILLLLVVVAQLTLALSSHPSLCLRHLVRIVGSWRKALVLIETLRIRGRVGARAVVLADRVVALLAAVAGVCVRQPVSLSVTAQLIVVRGGVCTLLLGVWAGGAYHGHGFATAAASRRSGRGWGISSKGLSTLGEVFGGAFDLCERYVSQKSAIQWQWRGPVIATATATDTATANAICVSAAYHRIARQRHWPRRDAPSSWRLNPRYSVSCHGCSHCVRYLSARAAGAAPTRIGGQVQAQATRGRCSKTWAAVVAGGRMEMLREKSSEALLCAVTMSETERETERERG